MATRIPDVGHKKAPVAVVVGAGPGLGFSVANKFAKEGYQVMLMARNQERVMAAAEEIVKESNGAHAAGIAVDCTDVNSVKNAFESAATLGDIEVLVYNASSPFPWPPPKFTDITAESFENSLTVQCVGAFHCAQQVLAGMEARKKGTLLFTGATASTRGGKGFAEIACGKFALRALAQCLAREYQPAGIHVAHVIVDGIIDTPRTQERRRRPPEQTLGPDAMAETFWHLHSQRQSAWSHEVDLRPFCEKF
eukprot:jgi/Mesen1/7170/ME000037S06529